MSEVPLVERFTPDVIQNRGIAVPVLPTEDNPEGIRYVRFLASHIAKAEDLYDGIRGQVEVFADEVVRGDNGEPMVGPNGVITRKVRTGVEERVFYGQQALQHQMTEKPTSTAMDLIGLAWKLDREALDEIMIPSELASYQMAVSNAWALAQGVDPTLAARMMTKAHEGLDARRKALASQLAETMDQALAEPIELPGLLGAKDGAAPGEASTTSGDPAPDRSSLSSEPTAS